MTALCPSRRRLLHLLGVGLTTVVAGCESSPPDTQPPTTSSPPTTDTSLTAQSERPTDTSTSESTATPDLPPGKLVPDDGDTDDNFGSAVAVTGDRALVAAMRDDPNGSWSGSAYVFERNEEEWTQEAKLVPRDGDTYDRFGSDVALSGETALVGAFDDSDPNGEQAGAAYVFERLEGEWVQQTKLLPENGDSWDHFGSSVSLSGDRAVIGAATDEDPSGGSPKHGAGSVSVFERTGDEWVQQATLAARDGDSDDRFGDVVAQSGSTVLVGAANDEDPNGRGSGSAYVFEQREGTWTQHATLVPDDGDEGDGFGEAVALADDVAVVSAEYDENPHGRDAGSVYVFVAVDGEWSQQTKLAAPNGGVGTQFGQAVALVGDTVLVGSGAGEDFDAAHEDRETGASGTGSVHAYRHTADGGWSHHETLTAVDGDPEDRFGVAVAAHERTVIVGAVGDEDPHGEGAGAAYVVDLSE